MHRAEILMRAALMGGDKCVQTTRWGITAEGSERSQSCICSDVSDLCVYLHGSRISILVRDKKIRHAVQLSAYLYRLCSRGLIYETIVRHTAECLLAQVIHKSVSNAYKCIFSVFHCYT